MTVYEYEKLRPKLFSEEGSVTFVAVRDRARRLVNEAGAVTMGAAIRAASGDSWLAIACVDRLVELGELREVFDPFARTQDRVFVAGGRWKEG